MVDENLSVYALFMRQVIARPNATAVQCGMERLSYSELYRQQHMLSVMLKQCDIAVGQTVGIYLERGNALMIALLAIMHEGAAFLLLDLAAPRERMARIVKQSGIRYVITHRSMPELPGGAAVSPIYLDDCPDVETDPTPEVAFARSALCYLMFTSGSTGTPKAVQITHDGLSHVIQAMAAEIGLTESDNVLALSSVGFDISLLELFMPLVCGAASTIVPQAGLGDVSAIRAIIDDAGVTVLQATPSSFRLLLAGSWSPQRRQKILCGGEILPPSLLASLLSAGDRIWHLYGPTETTIWSLVQLIERADTPILLGKPIGRTEIRVLDSNHRPVAHGETGELYIGGAGVGIGYLNSDQHRFAALEPGGPLFFRTGDRVRRIALGLEFLGRSDRQIKIRGHRIELDEVESVLRAHPMVAAAAVTALCADGICTATLGYIVLRPLDGDSPNDFADLAIAEIKSWLGKQLLPAAVPRHYLLLDALPMSSSGKMDYSALPVILPVSSHSDMVTSPHMVELKLTSLWQEILKLDQIEWNADFFSIGGDSLKAAILTFQIEQKFGINFSIDEVLENSSLQSMAAQIAKTALPSEEL